MLIAKIEYRISQYLRFLKSHRYREISPLEFEAYETAHSYRIPPPAVQWEPISTPYPYGKAWHCSWFRASFSVPADPPYPLYLRVRPNADSLAFIDGKPAGSFNPFHKKLCLQNIAAGDHKLHIESYSGHPYPGCHPFEERSIILTLSRTIPDYPNIFEGGALTAQITPIYALYYDVLCLFEAAKTMDANSLRKAQILRGLYEALMPLHYSATGTDLEGEAETARQALAPLLALKNSATTPHIHLIGHAHIDHAWLWHIGETERKVARTYSMMTHFAEEYPEFVFIQTQAAQLEIIHREYPDIFAAVQRAYTSGNWEPNGGMWVEADCNLTGGESLIRQFLVGKATIKQLLGYEGDTLWLPDVFGYAAALPQILAGCRIKYFVTSKINWNDTSRFPYDTFIWRGIDGSGIKTHFISSRKQGYNGRVGPEYLVELWNQIQHKEVQHAAINAVGEGDGGGGTTRGDLELARRLRDLEGIPKAAWKKVSAALDDIFRDESAWPEWRGELYLELHRGTYTTQAKTKGYNRRLEFNIRHTEWLCTLAAFEGWLPYPHAALRENWKLLLTNQFHDIIPGSAIHRVYAEAEAVYRQIHASLDSITKAVARTITQSGGFFVFNDLSWERSSPVTFAEAEGLKHVQTLIAADGKYYPLQRYSTLDGTPVCVFVPTVPPLGWTRFIPAESAALPSPFCYQDGSLTTPFYWVQFDQFGRITSLRTRTPDPDGTESREWVAPGGTFNRFISAQDVPILWEAWDIDADWTKYLIEETRLLAATIVADGPVCFRIRRTYRIGTASTLTQDTVFYARERRIDFETQVDWQERQRLLKVGFDTAIDATHVRCEVQYGHLLRNTHKNLPTDRAQFEICAHKWICVEEAGGGIALLNDSKYGHDVEGGRMRLTLLRSPIAPDETADRGEQRFSYALLPFTGSFSDSDVVRSGYAFNAPAVVEYGGKPAEPCTAHTEAVSGTYSLLSIDRKGIIVESIKAPESGETTSMIIRLYESLGGRERAVLSFSRQPVSVWVTDMLESDLQALAVVGNTVSLEFRSFEIKTLKVNFC